MKRPVLLVILWFGLLSVAAAAGVESLDFGGKVNEHRYKQLISQLRCLVCQNETLADSQADLAQDLRVEIYDMMKAGRSDADITKFLVDRYGDFVLYNPPVKRSTWLIWYGPFFLLLAGLVLLIVTVRKRSRQTDAELSDAERERLRTLLDTPDNNSESQS